MKIFYPRLLIPEKFFIRFVCSQKNILSAAASLRKFIICAFLSEKSVNPQLHHFSQKKSFSKKIIYPRLSLGEKVFSAQHFPRKYLCAIISLSKIFIRTTSFVKMCKPQHFLNEKKIRIIFCQQMLYPILFLIPKIFSKEIFYPEQIFYFNYLSSIFSTKKKIIRIIFCQKIFHPHNFSQKNIYILFATYSPRKSFMRSILSEKNSYPHLFLEKKIFFL